MLIVLIDYSICRSKDQFHLIEKTIGDQVTNNYLKRFGLKKDNGALVRGSQKRGWRRSQNSSNSKGKKGFTDFRDLNLRTTVSI